MFLIDLYLFYFFSFERVFFLILRSEFLRDLAGKFTHEFGWCGLGVKVVGILGSFQVSGTGHFYVAHEAKFSAI